MPTNTRLDRLLPRHPLPVHAQFRWDVKDDRRFPPRSNPFVMATIIDISLEGALIEVPATSRHQIGEQVAIRFGGVDGHAKVRHVQAGDRGRGGDRRRGGDRGGGTVRYGIQWVSEPDLAASVGQAVAAVRGDDAQLRAAWESPHR